MDDPEFDGHLGRLFAQTPVFADADGFARRIENRLDRSWALRRILIGAAGLFGGIYAAGQMLGARLWDQAVGASAPSVAAATESIRAFGNLRLLTLLPVGSEVMWMGAGLAILALVLAATRALEEF